MRLQTGVTDRLDLGGAAEDIARPAGETIQMDYRDDMSKYQESSTEI